jgi:L-lactate dehydrogenase complex protein LldG
MSAEPSSSRDQILSRVRRALAPLPRSAPLPEWERELIRFRTAAATGISPWTLFAERMKSVNGVPLPGLNELVAFLRERKFLRGYCDPEVQPLVAAAFSAEFVLETTLDRARIDDYQFGITAVAGAIAETGTLILSDATTARRLGALAPWVHIAVVRESQIHPDIATAISALPDDPNVIWVTGPSKTADVEGILIEGVHGPGIQIAVRLA